MRRVAVFMRSKSGFDTLLPNLEHVMHFVAVCRPGGPTIGRNPVEFVRNEPGFGRRSLDIGLNLAEAGPNLGECGRIPVNGELHVARVEPKLVRKRPHLERNRHLSEK